MSKFGAASKLGIRVLTLGLRVDDESWEKRLNSTNFSE